MAKRRIALIASAGDPPLKVDAEVAQIKERLEQELKEPVDIHVLASDSEFKPTGARFREVLLSGGYDIVHYAGHAAFDPARHAQSGLLLDEREVSFAQKIQRLLQSNPLVFLTHVRRPG